MPGYLELLRQERIKAGEVCPPLRYIDGANLANLVTSYTHPLISLQSPHELQENKFFNDINDACISEKSPPYEVTRFTRFAYLGAFEALRTKRPERVLNPRYVQALVDAEDFLATWGGPAEALGWTTDDLFGLDPVAPLQRYDAMGLIWLLQGKPVIALTECTAVIGCKTGSLTFYRRGVDFPWRRTVSKTKPSETMPKPA